MALGHYMHLYVSCFYTVIGFYGVIQNIMSIFVD